MACSYICHFNLTFLPSVILSIGSSSCLRLSSSVVHRRWRSGPSVAISPQAPSCPPLAACPNCPQSSSPWPSWLLPSIMVIDHSDWIAPALFLPPCLLSSISPIKSLEHTCLLLFLFWRCPYKSFLSSAPCGGLLVSQRD